jgi:hypothetical protein
MIFEFGSRNAEREREKAEVHAEFGMGKAEKQRQTVEGLGYRVKNCYNPAPLAIRR